MMFEAFQGMQIVSTCLLQQFYLLSYCGVVHCHSFILRNINILRESEIIPYYIDMHKYIYTRGTPAFGGISLAHWGSGAFGAHFFNMLQGQRQDLGYESYDYIMLQIKLFSDNYVRKFILI